MPQHVLRPKPSSIRGLLWMSAGFALIVMISASLLLSLTVSPPPEVIAQSGEVRVFDDDSYCVDDSACGADTLCVNNACVRANCQIDDECGSNEMCIRYTCSEPACESQGDCPEGTACADGMCLATLEARLSGDKREMILIPGGDFIMGSDRADAVSDEKPPHRVEVSSYWIDTYEVTASEYAACVDAGGCSAADVMAYAEWDQCNYGDVSRNHHPMNCVSWQSAFDYCAWAGKRLPTEAEWARAAGEGQGRRYAWGKETPDCEITCRRENEDGCGTTFSCVSGSKTGDVSLFGVRDMGGNVAEWVLDWYDRSSYDTAHRLNPVTLDGEMEKRVVRGGDYQKEQDAFRLTSRDRLTPTYKAPNVGFRCARDL